MLQRFSKNSDDAQALLSETTGAVSNSSLISCIDGGDNFLYCHYFFGPQY